MTITLTSFCKLKVYVLCECHLMHLLYIYGLFYMWTLEFYLFLLCERASMSTFYASTCAFSCSYLFRWSKRKRNVTRLGSGSDSNKFNMQLSLATLSDRAERKKREEVSYMLVVVYPIKEGFFLSSPWAATVCPTAALIISLLGCLFSR